MAGNKRLICVYQQLQHVCCTYKNNYTIFFGSQFCSFSFSFYLFFRLYFILFLSLNLPALVIRRHCLSPHKLLWSYRRDRRDTCQCLNRCRARTPIWVNVLSSPAGQIISINIYICVCVQFHIVVSNFSVVELSLSFGEGIQPAAQHTGKEKQSKRISWCWEYK